MDYTNTNSEEFKIVQLLTKQLNLPISDAVLRQQTANRPFSVPFRNIVNILPDLNIDAALFEFKKEEFANINDFNFPCLVLLNDKDKNYSAIVSKVENGLVHYQTIQQQIVDKWIDFVNVWSGHTLLIFPKDEENKENLRENKQKESFGKPEAAKMGVSILAVALWLAVALHLFTPSSLLNFGLWHLKIFGVVISALLIAHDINGENSLVNQLCTLGKSDCNKVLEDKNAKLFGLISWSDLGFVYFVGSALFLLIGANNPQNTASLLFLINVPCVLFSFYSLWFQLFKAKELCYFCLAILGLFWIEFALFLLSDFVTFKLDVLNFNAILMGLFSFGLPIILLYFLFHFAEKAKLYQTTKTELNALKYDSDVFNRLWAANPIIPNDKEGPLSILSNSEATNNITIVTTPRCPPCFVAHQQLEDYIKGNYEHLTINLVFAVNPATEKDTDAYKIAKRIVALHKYQGRTVANQATFDWYDMNKEFKDFNEWAANYPVENEDVDEQLAAFETWRKSNKITHTPTIIFNGRKIPSFYNVADLRYFMN
jgi:uncharacterized membrane protein